MTGSNTPPDQQILTTMERNQLIAILETALAVLKAPMLERGILKELKSKLGKAAAKSAEKKSEEGLGKMAEVAAKWASDLLGNLWPPGS